MADIIHFSSKKELDASQNISEFINQCRNELTAFGSELAFDQNTWDLTAHIHLPGKTKKVNAIFSCFDAARMNNSCPAMSQEFLPFAKAYFRYMHAHRSTKVIGFRLTALRALDHTLCARGMNGNICKVTHDVLDQACSLINESYSQGVAVKIAGQLELLSNFLIAKNFVDMKSKWLQPLKKPKDLGIRVGKTADEARLMKMPSAAAIQAMAHVFHEGVTPIEIVVGSTLALLHCAPQRLNETVRLAHDCEIVEGTAKGDIYSLRWCGSKGFPDGKKAIGPAMREVAEKAIRNLKEASSEARKIALWYERNPNKIYLTEATEHLRSKERLTADEVSQVLFGFNDALKGRTWCQSRKIKGRNLNGYSFKNIEECVLEMLPKSFPYAQKGLKFCDALFIARRFEFDARLSTYCCVIDYIPADQISNRLGENKSATSVFSRFELKEDDGTAVSLSSHQVRHYLNTLAQSNGISEMDVAMWSGRISIKQNDDYGHVTPGSILNKLTAVVTSSKSVLFGGDLNTPKVRVVAARDSVGNLKNLTAHITDFGMCTHDYAQTPCQIHLDCLNCNELVCVKGDVVKTENIRRLRDSTEILLLEAEKAEQVEVYGASRWVTHQQRTLQHCNQLLKILDSSSVEVGALVKLTGIEPASRIQQAQHERNEETIKSVPTRKNKLLERVTRG